jgi:hypothetical protein
MRAKRILWAALLLIAGLALAVAMSVGSAVASPRAVADQTYSDAVGDANGGPDVTGVTVTNDANGTVTMVISVALPAESFMLVGIDNNLDATTERYMGVLSLGSGLFMKVFSSTDPQMALVGSLQLSGTDTTATLSFAKSDVGINQAFNFVIGTARSLDQSDLSDFAGPYQYTLATAPPPPPPPTTTTPAPAVVTPVIGSPVMTPLKAIAGKRMTVTFAVTRSDNGQPLTSGKMVCDPSVAGKVIRHAESFKAGTAKLSFLVPKAAKGKQLKVKVTIKAGTQSATKVVAFRVR